jgi:hypothetical protein
MNECVICGTGIPIRQGRGRQLKTCGQSCKVALAKKTAEAKKNQYKPCTVDGCTRMANRTGLGLCEVHYYRKRRNGSTELTGLGNPEDVEHSAGYMLRRAKGHPMAVGGSRAYVHRMVYYDAYGEGPFACKWCGKEVTWDNLHIDHLNEDKKDNSLSNLAASCCKCNTGRGMEMKKARRAAKSGIEMNGEIHTINGWAELIGISRPALVARIKKGWPLEKALSEPRGKFGPKPEK